ncbi:hypothetical protein CEXT_572421, partial [Caerostris extrusa]
PAKGTTYLRACEVIKRTTRGTLLSLSDIFWP